MDYRVYQLSMKENGMIVLMAAGITAGLSYLFYESMIGMLGWIPCVLFLRRRERMQRGQKRRDVLTLHFLDAMRAVSTALMGGYSVENAWKEAQREVEMLHGTDGDMYRELQEMNQSVSLRVPIEGLLEDFAMRSGVEDIISFSEVFSFAKRSGGNFVKIIDSTAEHMRQKQRTEQEIAVAVASKRMEQKVMNLLPLLILAYLKISSDGYLDPLYHNAKGVLFMSVCLGVYFAAMLLADKIMHIRI